MATKLQRITELAQDKTRTLTSNYENWTAFLSSSAWLYKYPFHKQVLIHAQRPGAKACAPIEMWNSKLHRWVNKDAKGIALIDDSGDSVRLKHVFDVADTHSLYDIPF